MNHTEYWYRFEDRRVSNYDPWEDRSYGSDLHIYVHRFEVVKTTPKGVQLWVWGRKRFVLRDARRRYACPTLDEARESFIARKERQIGIYEARAANAQEALDYVKRPSLIADRKRFGLDKETG